MSHPVDPRRPRPQTSPPRPRTEPATPRHPTPPVGPSVKPKKDKDK
jgi:hypothetical protein